MKKRLPYTAPTAVALRISSADIITLSPVREDGSPMEVGFGDFFYFD